MDGATAPLMNQPEPIQNIPAWSRSAQATATASRFI
jgi:hypothetical protein